MPAPDSPARAALALEAALVLGLPAGTVDVMSAQLLASALLFAGLVLVAGTVLARESTITHLKGEDQ